MGWSYGSKPASPVDYLKGLIELDDERETRKVLKSALHGYSTWYAAVERIEKATRARSVEAFVILVRFTRDEMGYKGLHEEMGPVETHCPESILDLLTPTTNPHALQWRASCRERHAKRRLVNAALKVAKPGDLVVLKGASVPSVEFVQLAETGTAILGRREGTLYRVRRVFIDRVEHKATGSEAPARPLQTSTEA